MNAQDLIQNAPVLERVSGGTCSTALITGGSRGIGQAIVRCLAQAGYNVVFTYANGTYEPEIGENGACILPVRADVREPDAAAEVVDLIRQTFKSLDVLINNAGIIRDRALVNMTEQEWDDVINTNLRGPFLYSRAASRIFVRQMKGRIINITSVAGLRGAAGQANYSASKAGLIGLTKSMARELGPFNVTVNAVAPGYIETEMTSQLNPALISHVRKTTPLRRFGLPHEVAAWVRFLASDAASYVTGQVIAIDGGLGI